MSSLSGISGSLASRWSSVQTSGRAQRPPGEVDGSKLFAKLDADGSGGVDGSELQSMLDKLASAKGGSATTATSSATTSGSASAEEMLASLDRDGDGSLGQTELAEGLKDLMPPPSSTLAFAQQRNEATGASDNRAARFAELDSDGDGSLSAAEFEAGAPSRGAGGPPPGPPPGAGPGPTSSSTDPADTNGDGVVSAEEEAAAAASALLDGSTSSTTNTSGLNELFQAIDGDGDGSLSEDELGGFVTQLASALAGPASGSVQIGQGGASADSSTSPEDGASRFASQLLREYTRVTDQPGSGFSQVLSLSA